MGNQVNLVEPISLTLKPKIVNSIKTCIFSVHSKCERPSIWGGIMANKFISVGIGLPLAAEAKQLDRQGMGLPSNLSSKYKNRYALG